MVTWVQSSNTDNTITAVLLIVSACIYIDSILEFIPQLLINNCILNFVKSINLT